jgi:hypothetical protein
MKKKIEKIFNGISLGQIFQTIPSGLFLVDTDKRILLRIPEEYGHRFRCNVGHPFRSKLDQAFRSNLSH